MISHLRAPLALASLFVLLMASSASASHYRLSSGFELVTDAERMALKGAKIHTTADLLQATAKKRARRTLAKKTRISLKRLTALAQQCDLLRIKGLGPSGVRLLQAAKVMHVAALKGGNAKALHSKLQTLKSTLALPHVVPSAAELAAWISQAKGLKRILEGVR
ncbi:MAG: DUF4332 domain-containing protein [Myxococcota bacterium]